MAFDEARVMPDAAALAKVKAAIDTYNAQRPGMLVGLWQRQINMLAPYAVIAGIIVLAILMKVEQPKILGFVVPALIGGGYLVWREGTRPMREFRQTLRDRMLPLIFKFAGRLKYANGVAPRFMARLPNPGLVRFGMARHDDLVSGIYEGMDFTLSEVRLSTGGKSDKTVFDGVILYFNPTYHFPGRLYAAKRLYGVSGFIDDLFGDMSLQRISCGRADLDESHEFRTDRPEEAGPLVTGPIVSMLDYLGDEWPEGTLRLALVGADAFLMVPTSRDFFELPEMERDIDYENDVLPMIRDLVMLLAMAKLVSRIGTVETASGEVGETATGEAGGGRAV
ncbi:hypothetical protein OIU34_02210 [Pararhizobium sp. BT-229]|uniref:hypothetical protein n=1 Tax=Pararhizobium sp. BT-229 TaxID=2986923 RepID=UPI0021F6E916|nr:hypothetical protein [Pararhizobium sp. BT-229]MCV9960700.1 hypothetical protein [Pararhizobium sp. BT-229]